MPHGRSALLLVLDGLLAIGAVGGSWGLVSGSVDASSYVHRLPFRSTAFGGLALALVVAVPAVVAFVATWRRQAWAAVAQIVAGGLLMGWIAVQVGFIGLSSWLQPVMFLWGLVLVSLGLAGRRDDRLTQ